MTLYYVDTCIYLNLWQKEESRGVLWWKHALEFFETLSDQDVILFSGFVLRELEWVLGKEVFQRKRILFTSEGFQKVVVTQEDVGMARTLEAGLFFEISFYDCLHLILAKKCAATLITQDRKLLRAAKTHHVRARVPEG